MNTLKKYSLIILLLALGNTCVHAQYFGRNKVNYETFDFKVDQTQHFDVYTYLKNPAYVQQFSNWAEQWYNLHQHILGDTIKSKNPILLYNNHADFQQTNAVYGSIGVGTGGVTEAFKNRVILPVAMSNQQTFHVLGHELVHAFQYDMIINNDSTNLNNIGNLPLWFVEGLAEYMSIGSTDPLTAMWMRDAVLSNDVPKIKDLDNINKYFPYRYGQAFWAFVTGMYGDEIIAPFYKAVAKFGFQAACPMVLGMSMDNLSSLWVSTLKSRYGSYLGDKKERFVGKKLISSENAGRMNIAPVLSPNGRYIIFLSEKDLFGVDLYLADATSGKILRKVASTAKDGHIDDFDYIESAGTWSPNGEEFAFVAFSKGRNILLIKEAQTGKTIREIEIKEVPSFSNPVWSPDGKTIVFAGLVQGQVDLYSYNLRTKKVEQLTNDIYSEMLPHWSSDGSKILFSTDEVSMKEGRSAGSWHFNLAELDLASHQKTNIDVFPGADNLNPMYDSNGDIWFLSDRDGFRNIYKYERATGKVYQMTDVLTGVSGITPFAPAMSLDLRRNRVAYMYFAKNGYTIYRAKNEDFLNKEVDPQAVDLSPATLPRVNPQASHVVDNQLANLDQNTVTASPTPIPYKSKFKLDYAGGSTGVGVGTSSSFGTTTGIAGAVDLLFSDIIGNHQLYTSIAMNGEITDFGGAVSYVNRKTRFNWGGTVSHIPFRSPFYGGQGIEEIPVQGGNYLAFADTFYIQRIFEDKAGVFGYYPFSTTLRLEGNAYYTHYGSRIDQYVNYYQTDGYYIGNYIGQDRHKVASAPGFGLWSVGTALVGDNSYFGLTAPLKGYRFRIGLDKYFGDYDFTAATLDFRAYKFFKPIGLALRVMHYGRYGKDNDTFYPIYVGNPWYVRGYSSSKTDQTLIQNNLSYDQLVGSKIAVANFEVRIPFTGPERLTLIKSKFLLTDLNFFADGGVAWSNFDQFNPPTDSNIIEAKPIFSVGTSVRVNLFGALVLEPYYAIPLLKDSKGVFGLNFIPGW